MPSTRFLSALAALCLAGAFVSTASAQLPGWETFGPPLFQVNSVAAGPGLTVFASGADYAASQGALYRSADSGLTWKVVAEATRNEYFSDILVDPTDSERVFAGAPDGDASATNIYRSSDGGTSFIASFIVTPYCVPSFAKGRSPDTVLLACGLRLARTDDAGLSWHDLQSPSTEPVRLTSGPGGTLFAYGTTQIFKSASDGSSWVPVGSAPAACPGLNALRVDPQDSRVLVAGVGLIGGSGFQCGGAYVSTDGGSTWNAGALRGVYVTDIAIDPDDPALVYASASYVAGILPPGGVFGSRDGGSSWSDLRLPALGAVRVATSQSGRHLYAATSLGVFEQGVRKTLVIAPRQ